MHEPISTSHEFGQARHREYVAEIGHFANVKKGHPEAVTSKP